MNKNAVWVVLAVIVLAVVAYFLYNNTQTTTPAPQPRVTETFPIPTTTTAVTINLSEQNESSQSGTAVLTEVGGKVMVSLNLVGAPAGVVQPAHIHKGSCPKPADVLYPLTSPVDGKSETSLDITFDILKTEMPLAVNVHKSAQQVGVYVACGNLTF